MPTEQLTIERPTRERLPLRGNAHAERAARATLKAQVARLERELSQIVASNFPHIPSPVEEPERRAARVDGRAGQIGGRAGRIGGWAGRIGGWAGRIGGWAGRVNRRAGQIGGWADRVDGPRLLTLGELERQRDELVLRIAAARRRSAERDLLERRSRALLAEMKRAPERHKFVRLPVADLGEGRCGYWQVRPRLGPIGMLAGWWEVKLSSGCP